MHVKSLEVFGFKSFVDRVIFGFEQGITAIVGPNGCGKSNVVDAFRWGMGEQSPRRLRGKGMEDVIFAGSEQRAPVGMAEVVITFDNSDGSAPLAFSTFQEIEITRRLYRSGDSEFQINKVPCRLRDVLDFFRDTGIGTRGYAIVEQGRIAEIVSARPEERRILIEEAAGISKYKARRREAERKLEATEQNLLRVSDVLGEIKRQISSLERQAKKAARYKRLRETQRLLEVSIAKEERDDLIELIERLSQKSQGLSDSLSGFEAQLSKKEASLEQHRIDLEERERTVMTESEKLFGLRAEIKELEGRISYGRRERASLAESIESRKRESTTLGSQLEEANENLDRQADELRSILAALDQDEKAIKTAEFEAKDAESRLRTVETDREEVNRVLVDHLTLIARSEDRVVSLVDRRDEIDRRVRSSDERYEVHQNEKRRIDGNQKTLETGLRNLLSERDSLMHRSRDLSIRQNTTGERIRDLSVKLREKRELRETKRSRLQSLSELIQRREDLGSAARFLLNDEQSARFGLKGLLRDVLEIDHGFERAVEVILSGADEAVVIENGERALNAMDALNVAKAGRGVFVLKDAHAGTVPAPVPMGVSLFEKVRAKPGNEALVSRLLQGVSCVESLEEPVKAYGASPPCTFVTPGGDILSEDGVIRGGGDGGESGVLARVGEVRDLEIELEELEREVSVCESALEEAEHEAASIADQVENLRNRHHTAALAVASHEKDLEQSRDQLKAIGEAQEDHVAARASLLSELEGNEQESRDLEAVLFTTRQERSARQNELDKLGVQIGSASRELGRMNSIVTESRVQQRNRFDIKQRVEGTLSVTQNGVDELRRWIEQRDEDVRLANLRREELAKEIEECEGALTGQLSAEEAARRESEDKREAFEGSAAEVRALEEQARADRQAVNSKREELQKSQLEAQENQLRLDHLEIGIRDRWHLELAQWMPPNFSNVGQIGVGIELEENPEGSDAESEEGLDRREAEKNAELLRQDSSTRKKELEDVRRKVESVGEVNLGAIEEHEELRERNRFLTGQKEDLEYSVAQLRDAISRINRTSRKRFKETFDAVKEKFESNFPRLFRGGKASLSLSESEDVLDAGIEIMAQPPGKKLQSVNLLSGGEKTMTALALLISVFQVRPSPFFLLDEVDAALDDANVGRFNEMLAELANESQFLLITHNKRTIEVAKTLYGVTMEEKGVSKLVGVELA